MVTARRQEIYELIDQLPNDELGLVKKLIEDHIRAQQDPVFRSMLNAPLDDEPVTAADRRAIREGEKQVARGEVYPLDEVRRELALASIARPAKKRTKKKAK